MIFRRHGPLPASTRSAINVSAKTSRRAAILAQLETGGPQAVRLAQALAGRPMPECDREILDAAARLLTDVMRQPKRPKLAGSRNTPAAADDYFLRDFDSGDLVQLRGFAALFGSKSDPMPIHGGLREVLLPGAFDRRDFRSIRLTREHRDEWGLRGDLEIAQSNIGLMFRLSNIVANDISRTTIDLVTAGHISECSWTGTDLGQIISYDGETIFGIRRVENLSEICVAPVGAYRETGCWTSANGKRRPHHFALRHMWDLDAPGVEWVSAKPKPGLAATAAAANLGIPK